MGYMPSFIGGPSKQGDKMNNLPDNHPCNPGYPGDPGYPGNPGNPGYYGNGYLDNTPLRGSEYRTRNPYDAPMRVAEKSIYRVNFRLNLASAILAALPIAFGVLYIIIMIVLILCTFFLILMGMEMYFKELIITCVPMLVFVTIAFVLDFVGFKAKKDNPQSKLLGVTSIYLIVIHAVWIVLFIAYRGILGRIRFFLIPISVAGIVCSVISFILLLMFRNRKNRVKAMRE